MEKVLIDDAADARYVSSGHLVFVRRGTLMAAPFDVTRLELAGGTVALVDGVMQAINNGLDADSGAAHFTMSGDGTLIYATGGITPRRSNVVVAVDRNGRSSPLGVAPGQYWALKLHPDQIHLGLTTMGPEGNRVAAYDMVAGTVFPLTGREENGYRSIWTPDGKRFAFLSTVGGGRSHVYVRSSDGTGDAIRLTTGITTGLRGEQPISWSADGRYLAFLEHDPETNLDIHVLDMTDPDLRPRGVLETPAMEDAPVFSPNGRWLAYTSDDSGRQQVYIQPFPGPGNRVLIGPGVEPVWRGDEIIYLVRRNPTDREIEVHTAGVKIDASTVSVGTRQTLFTGVYQTNGIGHGYDVTRDGQRFFFVGPGDPAPEEATQLVVVNNWFEELKRRAPAR
jgi:hypothetical protein